ncbi:MAG: aspartate--ammonia ligase [Chitinophagales bacterium]|nr:aspartate--ammonia ligase [Chitinophagales bacterium]
MKPEEIKTKFPGLTLPKNYHSSLDALHTAHAFQQIRSFIHLNLETELDLHRVSAPLFVEQGTGINDDLNGVEKPVAFGIKELGTTRAEVVQSLAKWKRLALKKYDIPIGEGIYTDMHAIRPDETPDSIHSIFVDQWDWEQRISEDQRNLEFLKDTVKKLYYILLRVEKLIHKQYGIDRKLPNKIHFIHSEELLQLYPNLTPKEREFEITKKYGAVFIIGIGYELSNGEPHDGRSPDYDDWSTVNSEGYFGLNGDILVWHPILECAFEISSMGVRVDKNSLHNQLVIKDKTEREKLIYHRQLLNDQLPLCIGGGIGQSRVGVFFLNKAHIGEISVGIWSEEMREICNENGIYLL